MKKCKAVASVIRLFLFKRWMDDLFICPLAFQGHLHGQRVREANHRAAVQIFERVNSSLLPRNILDLHGLHVDEALEHLAQVLHDKIAGGL